MNLQCGGCRGLSDILQSVLWVDVGMIRPRDAVVRMSVKAKRGRDRAFPIRGTCDGISREMTCAEHECFTCNSGGRGLAERACGSARCVMGLAGQSRVRMQRAIRMGSRDTMFHVTQRDLAQRAPGKCAGLCLRLPKIWLEHCGAWQV